MTEFAYVEPRSPRGTVRLSDVEKIADSLKRGSLAVLPTETGYMLAALATLHANQVNVVGASDHTVTHSLYITDPDGNEIELYVDVPGVDWCNDPSLFAAPIRPLKL